MIIRIIRIDDADDHRYHPHHDVMRKTGNAKRGCRKRPTRSTTHGVSKTCRNPFSKLALFQRRCIKIKRRTKVNHPSSIFEKSHTPTPLLILTYTANNAKFSFSDWRSQKMKSSWFYFRAQQFHRVKKSTKPYRNSVFRVSFVPICADVPADSRLVLP